MQELNYDITFPTTYRFLERYNELIGASGKPEVFPLACYLTELCLVDIKLNKWLPSRVATSALYLSKKMVE